MRQPCVFGDRCELGCVERQAALLGRGVRVCWGVGTGLAAYRGLCA